LPCFITFARLESLGLPIPETAPKIQRWIDLLTRLSRAPVGAGTATGHISPNPPHTPVTQAPQC